MAQKFKIKKGDQVVVITGRDKGKKGEVITNDLVIGCKEKSIKINLLQKEGKTVLNTKSFFVTPIEFFGYPN